MFCPSGLRFFLSARYTEAFSCAQSKVKPEHSKESAGPTAEDLKTQGNTALKTGDTAGAIAKYTEAIAACEADDSRSGGMGQSGANLLAVCLTNRGIARMSTK